jgi:hypothetical protein
MTAAVAQENDFYPSDSRLGLKMHRSVFLPDWGQRAFSTDDFVTIP